MGKKSKQRISTESSGSSLFGDNPFAVISTDGLAEGPKPAKEPALPQAPSQAKTKGQRVEVRLEKSGRAGRWVTVLVSDFDQADLKPFLKELQKLCGVGGTAKDGTIELQGDQRQLVMDFLQSAGYRPVRVGA